MTTKIPKKESTNTPKNTPNKPKTEPYEAIITIMGRTSKNKGNTIKEAISGLDVGVVKGVGVLVIKHGNKTKERILSTLQTSRVFNTKGTTQEIFLKHITNLFDGI